LVGITPFGLPWANIRSDRLRKVLASFLAGATALALVAGGLFFAYGQELIHGGGNRWAEDAFMASFAVLINSALVIAAPSALPALAAAFAAFSSAASGLAGGVCMVLVLIVSVIAALA